MTASAQQEQQEQLEQGVDAFYAACSPFYDADYEAARQSEDVEFYRRIVAEAGGPFLELGCGTGRVFLPALRDGGSGVGVDVCREMLDRLDAALAAEPPEVRTRGRTVHADLTEIALGETFAVVTAPFRVVQHLVSRRSQRAFLRAAARHLEVGGELVFDAFQPDYEMISGPPQLSVDIERFDRELGTTVRRVSRAVHQPHDQTFDVEFEWLAETPEGPSKTLDRGKTRVRWFTASELIHLLELEGFEVVDLWGSFDRTPLGPDSEDQVFRARRLG